MNTSKELLNTNFERLKQLRPIDDEFMRVLFRDNRPLAQDVLRTLTGIDDLVLEEMETQRDMKRLSGARSVVLDVWGRDSSGAWYDLEVERKEGRASPRRARHQSAVMDNEALEKGHSTEELPEQYVIFVCEKDPYNRGEGVYAFERTCDKAGGSLGDGTYLLFVNGEYRGEDSIGRLMHDFCCADPHAMYNSLLRERALYFKENKEGMRDMSKVFDEIRAEGIEQGIELGRAEEREENRRNLLKTVSSMVRDGMLSLQDAVSRFGLTERELTAML